MDWQKEMVRRTLEGAGDQTGVQLQFLLQRLEAYPDALPAIADAIEDMAAFQAQQAQALRAEQARREASDQLTEITTPKK
jgi:hypothetical protein